MAQDEHPAPAPWFTTDISEASYAIAMGLELHGIRSSGENGQFEFTFKDPECRGESIATAFLASECFKYDQARRQIMKRLAGKRRNKERERRRGS